MRSTPSPASTAPTISRWAPRGDGSDSVASVLATGAGSLGDREVAVELPGRDLHAVVGPLLPLQLDIAGVDVRPERLLDDIGVRHLVDGLAERLRQPADP